MQTMKGKVVLKCIQLIVSVNYLFGKPLAQHFVSRCIMKFMSVVLAGIWIVKMLFHVQEDVKL